ncbi:MAG: glycolate oxidase subunit GlcE [Bacteroidetes bacterium]|nr:glycolate oxidase subunit GlcE [Bacteroidota bacterium]
MNDISQQLIDQVKTAYESKSSLVIKGGGSKQQCCGRTIQGESLLTSEHSGIVNYSPIELVITALSGTSLEELNHELDKNNQQLSFEPPGFGEKGTIGGTVACNLSGAARPWSGSIRDLLLGVRLINGKGEHLTFGGQVMKNVAGYDVTRLQAGALGCLGVLTEISLKIMPKPKDSITIIQEMSESEALLKMQQLASQPKPLSGLAWYDQKLYIRLSGESKTIQKTAQIWGGEQLAEATSFWRALNEQSLAFFQLDAHLWRFSIGPTAKSLVADTETIVDWAGSQRWVLGDYDPQQLHKIAKDAGGHVSLFSGGDRTAEVRQPLSDIERRLQKRMKDAFDPHGILNPGRLYSWM